MTFQSKDEMGLNPSPMLEPVIMLRLKLSGAIHVIHANKLKAGKMKPGSQKYTNMQENAIKKNLYREMVHPCMFSFFSGTRSALFRAKVGRMLGHRASTG